MFRHKKIFKVLLASIMINYSTAFFINVNIDIPGLVTSGFDSIYNLLTKSDNKGSEDLQMVYFKRSLEHKNLSKGYLLKDVAQLMDDIDPTKPFVLYIHGFSEDLTAGSVTTIVSAYLERNADNIVLLDWSKLSFGNYLVVMPRANEIAKATANAITNLVRAGLDVETLHVVGHSMGAQIAGFLRDFLDFQIPRLTGLDPANPGFYQFGARHINSSSGQQVDIIHTDGGFYGASEVTGSVDFFPNGGSRPQPGCNFIAMPLSKEDFCSHHKSWTYWAESVMNEKAFPALKCDSYESFNSGSCNSNHIVYYGYSMPKQLTGKYYFKTNDISPFGRGMDGIRSR